MSKADKARIDRIRATIEKLEEELRRLQRGPRTPKPAVGASVKA